MSLKRRHQLFAAVESQPGVAVASIRAVANADLLVIDPVMTFEPEIFERANFNRESMSPLQPLTGIVTGSCSFQTELSGRAAGNAPGWAPLLRACGFYQATSRRVAIGAISGGPFYHGETVTSDGAGAPTGTVIHQTFDGATTLMYEALTGTIGTGEGLTGGTSGATATTSGASAADGYAWWPSSTELMTFTGSVVTGTDFVAGEVVTGGSSNAVAVMNAAYTGPGTLTVRMLDGNFQASETITGATGSGTVVIDSGPGFTMTQVPSATVSLIEDGRYKELIGWRGSVSLSGAIGEAIMMNFEGRGIPNPAGSEGNAGAIPGTTYSALVPNALLGVTFRVGQDGTSYDTVAEEHAPRLHSFAFNHGNTLGIPRDATQTSGVYDSAHQTARSSDGSLVVNIAPEANFDWTTALRTGADVRTYLQLGAATDRFIITHPGAVLTGESGGEVEGIATVDYTLRFASRHHGGTDSSDGEIVISYTNA